jgi:hypothetical protein
MSHRLAVAGRLFEFRYDGVTKLGHVTVFTSDRLALTTLVLDNAVATRHAYPRFFIIRNCD